jgi:hypothetical protein
MALQPDDESKTGTLPDPELNPLLNPLLAANMGRWAEVYFTNPPEKRAQAVADLLRELEKNPPPERHSEPIEENIPEQAESNGGQGLLRRSLQSTGSLESNGAAVVCGACGHPNGTAQRFCGMCGMPLAVNEVSRLDPQPELTRQRSWHDQDPAETEIPERFHEESPVSYSSIPLPSFASLSEDNDSEDSDGLFRYESQPARRSYRLYIGLGLAIVLGLLVYKTWRGNASFFANHNAAVAVPQEAANPAQSVPSATSPPTAPPSAQPSKVNPSVPSQAATGASAPEQAPAKPAPSRRAPNPAPPAVAANSNPANSAGQMSGAAELAVAEKYLNGRPGTARDPREASVWLWKAVAQKNPTATLLLSDLYLRGEGVSKSCDQARLLLDAAARKGNAAAAERLRNLPAFGCQ